MFTATSWRKGIALPAIVTIALGGVLLAANPASAAPAGLTVVTPEAGSTVDSRTVTVSGSVFGGSTVIVYDAEGDDVLARTNPGGSFGQPTSYSLTLPTFADDASVEQTIVVGGLYGGSGIPRQPVTFNLPAVAPAFNFAVTTPTEGQALDSREVTFTGTGTNGSTVNVLTPEGNRVPGTTAAVVRNGQWATTGTYANDADVNQTVNVNQVTGGAGRGQATVNFTIPAVPVVTDPEGEQPVITDPEEEQPVVTDPSIDEPGVTAPSGDQSGETPVSAEGERELASTGTETAGFLGLAAALLLAGAATLIVRKRSTSTN